MNPHYNPQQLNVSAQLENDVVEDGYLGLKPGCEENEEQVLQIFPMKERKLRIGISLVLSNTTISVEQLERAYQNRNLKT